MKQCKPILDDERKKCMAVNKEEDIGKTCQTPLPAWQADGDNLLDDEMKEKLYRLSCPQ